MPIVTSAIVAVSAAIAVTTVSTVAAAAVAVSVVVGAVGLGLGVVGMALGNKDLMKAGQIMGYVGLAGGLAGLGAGALASAESVASGFVAPEVAASVTGAIDQAGQVGAGTVLAPAAANTATGAGTVLAPAATTAAEGGSTGLLEAAASTPAADPSALTATASPSPTQTPGEGAPWDTPVGGAGSVAPTETNLIPATQGPVGSLAGTAAPALTAAGTEQEALGRGIVAGTNTTGGPQPGDSLADGFKKLDATTKAHVAIAGGQALSGLAGGWFQGLSASDRLEFDKLMNEQRQGQVQYLNKNNAYAPKLSFKPKTGLIGAA